MTPSSSAATPRSCVPPASGFKMGQIPPSDQSYFSAASYSAIPVTTPLVETPPLSQTQTPSPTPASTENRPLSATPEMLHRLSMCFPSPPPTLSLSALRQRASEPSSPRIATSHRSTTPLDSVSCPTDRSRQSPSSPSCFPTMEVISSPNKHTLHVQLPVVIQPEMIIISANRGDKLKVVADAWHMQNNCHYEWQISFAPRDIDMAAIQAKFEANGHLFIDIRRLGGSAFGH